MQRSFLLSSGLKAERLSAVIAVLQKLQLDMYMKKVFALKEKYYLMMKEHVYVLMEQKEMNKESV